MIPYIEVQPFRVAGPFEVQPFALLVLAGIVAGILFARRRAAQSGLAPEMLAAPMALAVVAGMLSAHVLEVLFYFPERIAEQGVAAVFSTWQGLSSYGGFLGAALALAAYYRMSGRSFLVEGDVFVQGLVVGWIFGRAGCAVVHDHPGRLSDFFLAVDFPGGARHDLGLYELLYTALVLLPLILWIHHRHGAGRPAEPLARRSAPRHRRSRGRALPPPPGTYLAAVALAYAPARFLLDFLRAADLPGSDRRILGLTPGQYGSLTLLGVGLVLLAWRRRRTEREGPSRRG